LHLNKQTVLYQLVIPTRDSPSDPRLNELGPERQIARISLGSRFRIIQLDQISVRAISSESRRCLRRNAHAAERTIAIDPKIAFGRPVMIRAGVSTAAIAERIDANESVEELAADYGLSISEIEQALLFECSA
jgi:uncharacterized protein (DUF433 family)